MFRLKSDQHPFFLFQFLPDEKKHGEFRGGPSPAALAVKAPFQ